MRMSEGRETFNRLLNWDRGQAPSERLAAIILSKEGFNGVDPSHPFCLSDVLLRLTVHGLLLAESAILFQFDTVGVVFLVLHGVVVSLLAFIASERDLNSHVRHLLNTCLPAKLRLLKI